MVLTFLVATEVPFFTMRGLCAYTVKFLIEYLHEIGGSVLIVYSGPSVLRALRAEHTYTVIAA